MWYRYLLQSFCPVQVVETYDHLSHLIGSALVHEEMKWVIASLSLIYNQIKFRIDFASLLIKHDTTTQVIHDNQDNCEKGDLGSKQSHRDTGEYVYGTEAWNMPVESALARVWLIGMRAW